MKNNNLSKNTKEKEKESTLSLFRIPINYFADDKNSVSDSSSSSQTTVSTSDFKSSKESSTKSTTSSVANNQKVRLNPNEKNSIEVDFDFNLPNSSNPSTTTTTTSSKENNSKESSETTDSNDTESQDTDSSSSESKADSTGSNTDNSSKNIKPTTPQKPNATADAKADAKSDAKANATPPSDEPKPEEDSPKKVEGDTPSKPDEKKPDDSNDNDSSPNKDDATAPKDKKSPKGEKDKENPDSKNELDRLKDKYLNPQKKADLNKKPNALNKDAKPKLPGKANDIKNKLQNVKKYADAAKNIAEDPGKAAEAVGDAAVKVAGAAANAINPAAGKAIQAADKIIGQTEIGRKSKKAIGCCVCGCCAGGCLLPILAFLFIVIYFITSFSWALKWFGLESDFEGIDYDEYVDIQKASYADFSIENLVLEIQLGEAKLYAIEDIMTAVLNNKDPQNPTNDKSTFSLLKQDVDNYNSKNKQYIEDGKLSELAEGDLTSFGQIFTLFLDNYTVDHLKAPSLAAQSSKDNNVYTTSDLNTKHQALFEDVLNNVDGLKTRFDGQVHATWFDENLVDVLDKKFDVYIRSMNETRNLSLRDLLQETSSTSYDTEYDINIVRTALGDVYNNQEIITQYELLQKNLATLEMMTYMLYYQKFYHYKVELRTRTFKDCVNLYMYEDETFFNQFLTFTDISQLIALSSTTDHSLVYEISTAEIKMHLAKISDTSRETIGANTYGFMYRYSNWYATYNFAPEVTVGPDGSFTYSMPCISIDKTEIQQTLFDKYNVEANYRYGAGPDKVEQRDPEENAAVFFAFFEAATGIPMSVGDSGLQTPKYQLTSDRVEIPSAPVHPVDSGASGKITLPYNANYSDTTVAKYGVDRVHKGIDYGVPSGTTVYATSSGTAYTYYGNTGYGNYTKILHDDGYVSIYAHGNGTFYVSNASRVSRGQPIMQSGNSGNSTGPHLHFEVRNSSGTPINPTHYIYS